MGSKPAVPAWAGIGDFDVVWDWQQERWFLLASHMRPAASSDRTAGAGSWRKWDGAAFTRAGLGNQGEPLADTQGQRLPNGEHPAIQWNRWAEHCVPVCGLPCLSLAAGFTELVVWLPIV